MCLGRETSDSCTSNDLCGLPSNQRILLTPPHVSTGEMTPHSSHIKLETLSDARGILTRCTQGPLHLKNFSFVI